MSQLKLQVYKDVHSDGKARNSVFAKLNGSDIDVLFLEYSSSDKVLYKGKKVELNSFFQTLIRDRKKINVKDALASVDLFPRLNKSDAKPNLVDIAEQAIYNGVQVFVCDFCPEDALAKIRKEYQKNAQESWLVQPTGLKVRDEFAGALIGQLIAEGPFAKPAILWGANHFDADDGYKKGLCDIIIDAFDDNRHKGKRSLVEQVII